MELSPILNIDVGGRTFRVLRSTIMKYPESTLARVISGKDTDNMIISNNVFFFDRNPDYFAVVLDFMRSGKIFIPSNLSEEQLLNEMEFWRMHQYTNSSTSPDSVRSPIKPTTPPQDIQSTLMDQYTNPSTNPDSGRSPIKPTTPPPQDIQSTLIMEDEMQPTLLMNQDIEPTLIMQDEIQPTLLMNNQEEIQPTLIMNQDIQPTLIINQDIQPTLLMNQEEIQPTLLMNQDIQPTLLMPEEDTHQTDINKSVSDPLQSSESSFGILNYSLRSLQTPTRHVNIDGMLSSLVSQITPSPKDTPTFPSISVQNSANLSEDESFLQVSKPKRGKLGRKSGQVKSQIIKNLTDSLDSLDEYLDMAQVSKLAHQDYKPEDEPAVRGKRGRSSNTPRKALQEITDSFKSEEDAKETSVPQPAKRTFLPKVLESAESVSSEEDKTNKKPKLEETKQTPLKHIQPPSIIFSGLATTEIKQYESIIHKLGGEIVNSLDKATHLIQKEFARTLKSLEALIRGLDIVSVQWILDSGIHKTWQDTHNYNLVTQEVQRNFEFNLEEIRRKAGIRSKRYVDLYQGITFYFSPNVNPSAKDFKPLIEYSGGKCITTKPKNSAVIIISTTDTKDAKFNQEMEKRGFGVYTSELLKDSLMKQKIVYEPYRILGK